MPDPKNNDPKRSERSSGKDDGELPRGERGGPPRPPQPFANRNFMGWLVLAGLAVVFLYSFSS
jgi:hypothetical protein